MMNETSTVWKTVLRVMNAVAVTASVIAAAAPVISAAAAEVVQDNPRASAGAILLALLARVDWSKFRLPPAAGALLFVPFLGCAHGPRVVTCTEDVAMEHRGLAHQVSACLATNDYKACLAAVIGGSAAIYDLVSCLVADEASRVYGESTGNDLERQLRARAWLDEQRIRVAQ